MKNNKNNKGFSLVELIVVVLIMAIIAVALAPQVMKWVSNSRIAKDRQTVDSIVSAAELALTDEKAFSEVTGSTSDTTITVNGSTCTVGGTQFKTAFDNILDVSKTTLKSTDDTITITISKEGKVSSDAADVLDTNSDLDD